MQTQVVSVPVREAGDNMLLRSEGFMVGALIIMACITVANMRRKVLLHKLILLEVYIQEAVDEADADRFS